VQILADGLAQLGWGDVRYVGSSSTGNGCGDDKCSWAYDGDRQMAWYDDGSTTRRKFGAKWKAMDCIGFTADLDARALGVGINGSFKPPMGDFATHIDIVGGLTPVFTVQGGTRFKIRANWGPNFKFAPPPGFKPVCDFLILKKHEVRGGSGTQAAAAASAAATASPARFAPVTRMTSVSTQRADLLEQSHVTLEPTSGFHDVEYLAADNTVTGVRRCPSLVAVDVPLGPGAAWVFEATVLKVPDTTAPVFAVGVAASDFFGDSTRQVVLGDAAGAGWAVGVTTGPGRVGLPGAGELGVGDVLRCCVNVEHGTFSVARNGGELIECFRDVPATVRPAVTVGEGVTLQLNFGERPFKFPLAEAGAVLPVHVLFERLQQQQRHHAPLARQVSVLDDIPDNA
jgi:hypothetical protein